MGPGRKVGDFVRKTITQCRDRWGPTRSMEIHDMWLTTDRMTRRGQVEHPGGAEHQLLPN